MKVIKTTILTDIRPNDTENKGIYIEFIGKNNKKGTVEYWFNIGDESGIDNCQYQEDDDEDIYEEIHNWIEKHIKYQPAKIKVKK